MKNYSEFCDELQDVLMPFISGWYETVQSQRREGQLVSAKEFHEIIEAQYAIVSVLQKLQEVIESV